MHLNTNPTAHRALTQATIAARSRTLIKDHRLHTLNQPVFKYVNLKYALTRSEANI